jgi:CheY-like chemotaxis protein
MATILIIDDDPAARRVIGRILTDAGHWAIEAANGVEGVHLYQTQAPDLVVTDLIMPEKEGIQTITDILALAHKAPIIAMSGGGAGRAGLYLSMAEELGAAGVLPKPFRASDLLVMVGELLDPETAADSVRMSKQG